MKEGKRPKKSTHLQIIATVKEKEQHNIEHENGSIHFPMAGIKAKNSRKNPSSFAFSREINMQYTHIYELAEFCVSALDIL